MNQPFLPAYIYRLSFLLLGVVYLIGLFVPLMDNDSAHHANIALRMFLTGDYVNLVDEEKEYLDKPHLHFWLSAASYHIFGVTAFAYKFPSFLFTILGTYSTYRLGRTLYNTETGRLAALIVASAFAYILANNDVRMDAILTAGVIFATWQLVDWIKNQKAINAIGGALGLAIGFCTKGHIAVFVPCVGILFYLLYSGDWKKILHWQTLLVIFAFFFFIAPVVYCYYLQFDLHPEKLIRGKTGRSGVMFILWDQNFERFQGESFGGTNKNDKVFFLHSFLWAFAPWSIIAYAAFFSRLKSFINRKWEWLTIGSFITVLLVISLSGFKLPHYLNIIFPVAAVMTASYLLHNQDNKKLIRNLLVTQVIITVLCLLLAAAINVWAFPIENIICIIGFFVLLTAVVFMLRKLVSSFQKLIAVSVVCSVVSFYLMNSNFYPQLLTYQGGNTLAEKTKGKVNRENIYFWPFTYSPSFQFYTSTIEQPFSDSLLRNGTGPLWIVTEKKFLADFQKAGYPQLEVIAERDYPVGVLTGKFINPATRASVLDSMHLIRIR